MSTKTIYKCDLCGEFPKGRLENGGYPPLWEISIVRRPIDALSRYHEPTNLPSAEWCQDCMDKMQIPRPIIIADVKPDAPTLEQIVRKIVQEEISDA